MNVVIPRQIREQIDAANTAMQEAGLLPSTDAPPAEPAPPVEVTIQPAPGEPAAGDGIQPAPGEPAVQPPVAPPSNPPTVDWEHRHNSMKGRFDVMSAELTRAQAEIAALRERLAKPPAEPAATPVPADFELTPDERRDYGDDFVKVIEKRAKAAVHSELTKLQQETERLRRQVEGVTANTVADAHTRMIQGLNTLPFDWRAVNETDGWRSWLLLNDPLSGRNRNEMLLEAWNNNDAPRVARFFEGYLSETASAAPPRVQQQAAGATPAEPPAAPALSLESLAAPGSVRSGAGNSLPQEKPIFTPDQVGRFYTDKATSKYRGREALVAELQRQIEEAVSDGRVRG